MANEMEVYELTGMNNRKPIQVSRTGGGSVRLNSNWWANEVGVHGEANGVTFYIPWTVIEDIRQ